MNGGRSRVLRISHAPLCYCAWRRVEIASELPRRFCAGVEHGIATTPDGQIFFASLVGTISLARMNRHNPTSKACVTRGPMACYSERGTGIDGGDDPCATGLRKMTYLRRFSTSTPSRASAATSASEKPRARSTASPCSLKRGGALRVPPGVRDSFIGVPRPR